MLTKKHSPNNLLLILLCFIGMGSAQAQSIDWVSWDEAVNLNELEPKKLFVDVYTEWCGWCKKMDASTFSHPKIVEYINENYYSIKFDAEYKGDIELNGRVYKYVDSGKKGYHELAKEILKGQMSYPTVVFMDENFLLIQPIKGFQDVKTFNQIIHYFGEDYHKRTPWQKFTQIFNANQGFNDNVHPVKSAIGN